MRFQLEYRLDSLKKRKALSTQIFDTLHRIWVTPKYKLYKETPINETSYMCEVLTPLFSIAMSRLPFFPISGVFLWITIINYIGYLIFTSVLKGLDMLKANGKKIDFNNLNLDRSYTLEEFEFINDQLKTRILEIDGHPVNLFDLDKNGKLIPMPQSPYSREKVVAEIVRQLSNWNIWTRQNGGVTSSQGGFDFDVGGGKTIRAPDIAYTPKEIDCQLDAQQNWSFKGDPFTPIFVIEVGNISTHSKFEELDRKFKDVYFAEGTSVQLGWLIDPENKEIHVYRRDRCRINHGWKNVNAEDFLPRFTLEIWKIEHVISQKESVSPEPTGDDNTPRNCPFCSETLTDLKAEIANLKQSVENIEKQNRTVTNDLKSLEYSISLPSKNCSSGGNAQITVFSAHQEATSEQIDDTISDTSNLNETCSSKSKSLEDKEIDDFLDSENKKRINDEIRQRNKEKKLLHNKETSTSQDQDLPLVNQDTSTESEKIMTSSSLYDAKTVTKCHNQNHALAILILPPKYLNQIIKL
ncbi:10152_t:CDS:2 [Entrophospora sp. SA101]|nr:10152_t:CDS:2 [Entrophospora sp. SA101]